MTKLRFYLRLSICPSRRFVQTNVIFWRSYQITQVAIKQKKSKLLFMHIFNIYSPTWIVSFTSIITKTTLIIMFMHVISFWRNMTISSIENHKIYDNIFSNHFMRLVFYNDFCQKQFHKCIVSEENLSHQCFNHLNYWLCL